MMMFSIFAHVIATTAPYEDLSREELLTVVSELNLTTLKLQHELDQLKRIVFGSRS
jgi:hypothetical protein